MDIYVDGYCSGNPGPCGCRGILDNKEIFRVELGIGTNNIAEYIAIVMAINYVFNNNFRGVVIWSDSTTAIAWIANRRTNSSMEHYSLPRAKSYLYGIDTNGVLEVKKWDTKKRGEIPADYGLKKR